VAKPKKTSKASRALRVHETSMGKKADTRHAPYKKGKAEARSKEDKFRPKFRILYKELISILAVSEKLMFPQKTDRNMAGRNDVWCEFHKKFEHNIE